MVRAQRLIPYENAITQGLGPSPVELLTGTPFPRAGLMPWGIPHPNTIPQGLGPGHMEEVPSHGMSHGRSHGNSNGTSFAA